MKPRKQQAEQQGNGGVEQAPPSPNDSALRFRFTEAARELFHQYQGQTFTPEELWKMGISIRVAVARMHMVQV